MLKRLAHGSQNDGKQRRCVQNGEKDDARFPKSRCMMHRNFGHLSGTFIVGSLHRKFSVVYSHFPDAKIPRAVISPSVVKRIRFEKDVGIR